MSIKPFYVYKPTRDEAIEIVERIVANGGDCYDAVTGMNASPKGGFYKHNTYTAWGYSCDCTYTSNPDYGEWERDHRITMPQVRAMLPCDKYDGNDEWPKPGDWVISPGGAKMFFIGLNSAGRRLFELDSGGFMSFDRVDGFKPLPTARDSFIERVIEIIGSDSTTIEDTLGRIFDAGIVKDIKE